MAQASFKPGTSRSRVLRSAAAPHWLGNETVKEPWRIKSCEFDDVERVFLRRRPFLTLREVANSISARDNYSTREHPLSSRLLLFTPARE